MQRASDRMKSRFAQVRTRDEAGWVVIVAVVVMTLMLGLGLAVAKVVDNQAKLSGTERIRESSFNMAEGLLTAEAKLLQRSWPSKPMCTGNAQGCALPTAAVNAAGANACTNTNAATYPNQCPNPNEVRAAFRNVDTNASFSWSIQVRDDRSCAGLPNPIYFKGTGAANCGAGNPGGVDATNTGCVNDANGAFLCNYDNNGGSPNRRLWVRIDATVNGKTRSIVALLQLEKLGIPFPANAVTAGSVNFSNAGNKVIVDTTGSNIVARCNAPGATTISGNLFNNNLSFLVDSTNVNNYTVGAKYVLGSGGTAETVTIASRVIDIASGKVRINLTVPGATQPHSSGERFLLAPGENGNTCEQWIHGVQVTPQFNYVENPSYPAGLSAAELSLIEEGGATIYPAGTCPPDTVAGWTGQIVIMQAPAGSGNNKGCTMATSGNVAINSPSAPGFVIVVDQAGGASAGPALTMPNNTTYYGVVYVVNQQGAGPNDPAPLSIGSNAQICGGVAVDGNGQVAIGQANNGNSAIFCNNHQTGASIIFDPNAFNAFSAAGAAGLVQNTWRELAGNQ